MRVAESYHDYGTYGNYRESPSQHRDYSCRAYYASPMPEYRMRDDYSDSMSEWGLEQPLPMKLNNRIPMRRPYDPRDDSGREDIPRAYPKPGQDLPAGIYASPMQKPVAPEPHAFIKKTSKHTATTTKEEETSTKKKEKDAGNERFFKKRTDRYQKKTNSKSDPTQRHFSRHPRPAGRVDEKTSVSALFHQQRNHRSRNDNLGDFDFKYPSYRRGQYTNSVANSSPQSVFTMDKHRQMAEYRRRETQRHLMYQAQQYGYKPTSTSPQDEVCSTPSQTQDKNEKHFTSFSTSRDRVEKSSAASEDTERMGNSVASVVEVEDKKEEDVEQNDNSISRSNSNEEETESQMNETESPMKLKIETLEGISVQKCPGIDIKPDLKLIGSVELLENTTTEENKENEITQDTEGEWEIFDLSSYFDLVRQIMPRTLFTSQRECNRPGSKWYSYDCRARMYIRQQPAHHPIQPQHVAPPLHLTKAEFYEVIGE